MSESSRTLSTLERNQLARHLGPARYIKVTGLHSVSARRRRAIRYIEKLRVYLAGDNFEEADPQAAALAYFEEIRALLAAHCDPEFGRLLFRATEIMKPKRGPEGAAGIAGRWGAMCGAFGDPSTDAATLRYRQAERDARRPPRTR